MRDWLRGLRIKNNLTMKEIASKLGISESYYCSIENKTRQKNMDLALISGLSTVLNIPIAEIVQFESEIRKEG